MWKIVEAKVREVRMVKIERRRRKVKKEKMIEIKKVVEK